MRKTKGEACPKLVLSISGSEARIRIGRGVAKTLGTPEFICIYVSKENDALMVRPCREKEFLSIKVPSENGKRGAGGLRIYSLAFVTKLFEQNGWEMEKTYHMTGQFLPELNAVVFLYRGATGD